MTLAADLRRDGPNGLGSREPRRQAQHAADARTHGIERVFYSRYVSYVGRDIFQTKLDCTCGAAVAIIEYREHLVRRHCNVEGCTERALRTVSFGFRDPQFRLIVVPMGI
jgi:hypothetical protein